jgi:hypothetical protein
MLSEAKSRRIAGNKWFTLSRANALRLLLIMMILGIWSIGFGGKGCNWFRGDDDDDTGSSSPLATEKLSNVVDDNFWRILTNIIMPPPQYRL